MSASGFFGGGGGGEEGDAAPMARPVRLVPWVEKYRPKNVGDISSQEDIVRSLRNAVSTGNIPHMLFYGPPGTGKTSTILAMCRDLYGPELMKTRVMELNASDERGIAVVRDKVKHFAMGAVGSGGGGPPFKLIILDEADSLTHDAQAALRRTMETWSRVTRFCIICNYVSRIIDPLSSRCSKYRFSPLGEDAMRARLRHICAAERVDAGEDALTELLRLSAGDMRKAITYLQSAAQLYGGTVTPANVVEMSGVVSDKAMAPLLAAAMGGEEGAGGFDGVRKAVQGLLAAGYATGGILDKFADAVVAHPTLPNAVKAAALERIAGADKRLADGADEELQLVDAAATLLRGVQKLVVAADRERMYM